MFEEFEAILHRIESGLGCGKVGEVLQIFSRYSMDPERVTHCWQAQKILVCGRLWPFPDGFISL